VKYTVVFQNLYGLHYVLNHAVVTCAFAHFMQFGSILPWSKGDSSLVKKTTQIHISQFCAIPFRFEFGDFGFVIR
jgi:hypothetical protein